MQHLSPRDALQEIHQAVSAWARHESGASTLLIQLLVTLDRAGFQTIDVVDVPSNDEPPSGPTVTPGTEYGLGLATPRRAG